ncbi:MAG: 2Fe-2S iron-sulfur cluster binding domain-containing protein [Gemmataceae bacterium]|nr:2Fe-2S iron-sulfur cluster binding domain-containing protein [Gemmataceae bacterium]
MNLAPPPKTAASQLFWLGVFAVSIGLALALPGYGQVSPEDHKKHHPGQDKEKDKAGTPGMAPGGKEPAKGMGGGMDMGKMMEGMGKAPPKELYPTLMSLPDLTPEQREQVRRQAQERMQSGVALLSEGLERLAQATETEDYAAMQEATAQAREALARFESGLAAQRALAEGKPPRQVALQWFKGEMNLQPSQGVEVRGGRFGLSWFHLVVMAMLTAFAAVMIWMYFHKMQRATVLLQSLTSGAPPAAAAAAPARAAPPAADATAAPPAAVTPPTRDGSAPSVPAAGPPGKWLGKLRLSHIFQETPDVKTFRLMDPLGGEIPFSFQPGQYLSVTVWPEGKPVKRSYTIASSPTEHAYVDLTIKREDQGVESRYLHDRVQVGDLLDVAGPSGSFVFTGNECKCLVFIAAGVGITPLMSVTRYLTDRSWPGEIFLLYSCHSPPDFVFKEELEFRQRRHPNLHVIATVSKAEGTDWKGPTGRITKELILQSVPGIASRRVHICGPKEMMEATEKFLAELGVPKEQVKTEAFGPAIGKPEPEPKPTEGTAATLAAAMPQAPAAAPPAAAAVAVNVTFSRSAKTAPLPPEKSVLEASEDIGVNIPFECRVGTCGVCKTKLVSGQVTMAVEDALTPEDKAAGIILACQAKSTANVVVEA